MDFEKVTEELKASKIKTNRYVGVSETTVKNYIAKLKYLEKHNVLNENVIDYINTTYTAINSRSGYQTAVLGAAKHSKTFADFIGQDIIEKMTAENAKVMDEIRGNPKQDKTEKEEENWVSLPVLKKLAKQKAGEFNIQDRLLIACYTLMPPVRLDLNDVVIVRTDFIDETTGRPVGITEKQNYIRIYKKAGKFYTELVLNSYKTDKTYGEFRERLPKPITDLIMELPVNQTHLFQKKGGGPFSSAETFGVYLRSVFKKLTEKNISVDLLRHIYLTDFRKNEKTEETKQKVAKKMMNSVKEQTEYLRKENNSTTVI